MEKDRRMHRVGASKRKWMGQRMQSCRALGLWKVHTHRGVSRLFELQLQLQSLQERGGGGERVGDDGGGGGAGPGSRTLAGSHPLPLLLLLLLPPPQAVWLLPRHKQGCTS